MKTNDYKCKVVKKCILVCDGDNIEIYQCYECKEYFEAGGVVYATPDGMYLCENCFEDWQAKNTCPECGEERPDDDRVKAGMKCGFCAYGQENEKTEDN